MLLSTVVFANLIVGMVGTGYMGASIGSKAGRALNRKLRGKYSRFNEIVTIRSSSEITLDEWYCQRHKRWNWAGDECNCCAMEDGI